MFKFWSLIRLLFYIIRLEIKKNQSMENYEAWISYILLFIVIIFM